MYHKQLETESAGVLPMFTSIICVIICIKIFIPEGVKTKIDFSII